MKRPAGTGNAPTELAAVQASGSLLPARAIERREAIARGAEVPAADLAYAAELIDLADGEERWRPAAEKVLRSYGLRLLVPDRHKDAVRAFIDQHDMRGVVDYSIVTAISAHQPRPAPGTLASKLEVDITHPSGFWLGAQLTRQFEHVCVETARDLEPHPVAVTVRGTVKQRGNHYRKDDRPEVTSPSSYILGGNTAAKRAALEEEVADLAAAQQAGRDRGRPAGQRARQPHRHRHRGDPADRLHLLGRPGPLGLRARRRGPRGADPPAQGRQREPAATAGTARRRRTGLGAARRRLREDQGRHQRA